MDVMPVSRGRAVDEDHIRQFPSVQPMQKRTSFFSFQVIRKTTFAWLEPHPRVPT